ncbi:MAG: M55 family metallopeptidase [Candidatus Aminicenantes bacterium]|nr:M55 family metallopeptidase [Candidatus Aminicenantes bacterium]
MKRSAVLLAAVVALTVCLGAQGQTGHKVLISVDMEGIWGVVQGEQTSPDGRDYGLARKWMAEDVNAVIAGLLEAGATEIVVNDSHGSMRNIVASDLDPAATLISGTPKAFSMMEGLDAACEAVLFVGYHARAGTEAAVLDHTISGGTLRAVKINGREMPELGINGALAGAFGVPVIMLSGDDKTCAQAKAVLGEALVTVAVKDGLGRTSARLLPKDEARRRLKEGAKEAFLKRKQVAPFKLSVPLSFELEFHNSGQAELPLFIPGVKRTGARSVAFSADEFIEGYKLMRALIALASS